MAMVGLSISAVSSWVCTSMKPGATTLPLASISLSPLSAPGASTAAMRSPRNATSAANSFLPVPSATWPLRMTTSYPAITDSLGFVAAEPHVGVERIKRPLDLLVLEELEVGSRAAVAVAHHDVFGDRLEAGAEMLARLDQHVFLAPRIDAAVGEDAEIVGLGALLRDHDLHL